ncbi:MAG: hypothetical protein VKJ44_09040, partial [Synechococcus sp.]|nr:hypothetical protein [Synechococcus sp.]
MATYYRSGSEWVPDSSATFDAGFLGNGATIYLTGSSPSTVNNLSGTLNANPPSTSDSFDGSSGWVGGSIYNHGYWSPNPDGTSTWNWSYYNSFLGPYSGGGGAQNTYKDFNFDGLPVTISFDLHRFGSWDSETFYAYVNGVNVFQTSSGSSSWLGGAGSSYTGSTNGYNWSLVAQDSFADRIFSSYGDQTARVTVSLPSIFFASNSNLRLGFGSTLDESTDNESYGIDNLS